MYESDAWYIQDDLTAKPARKAVKPFTNYTDYAQTAPMNQADEEWDLDASASDNESYELEREQM
ncbi:hypothetical protein [Ammoniphilus sp. 3BR4]|uniref:hypothetical protein n=1 Tax=Ammoniphilus sp. 3BR4 TaxID=3158265 RepID=UPI003465C33A